MFPRENTGPQLLVLLIVIGRGATGGPVHALGA